MTDLSVASTSSASRSASVLSEQVSSHTIGTSNRQGAKSVTNFEIMPKPPVGRSESTPWPFWPLQLKTSSSHEEGCNRNWLINTKEFIDNEKG